MHYRSSPTDYKGAVDNSSAHSHSMTGRMAQLSSNEAPQSTDHLSRNPSYQRDGHAQRHGYYRQSSAHSGPNRCVTPTNVSSKTSSARTWSSSGGSSKTPISSRRRSSGQRGMSNNTQPKYHCRACGRLFPNWSQCLAHVRSWESGGAGHDLYQLTKTPAGRRELQKICKLPNPDAQGRSNSPSPSPSVSPAPSPTHELLGMSGSALPLPPGMPAKVGAVNASLPPTGRSPSPPLVYSEARPDGDKLGLAGHLSGQGGNPRAVSGLASGQQLQVQVGVQQSAREMSGAGTKEKMNRMQMYRPSPVITGSAFSRVFRQGQNSQSQYQDGAGQGGEILSLAASHQQHGALGSLGTLKHASGALGGTMSRLDRDMRMTPQEGFSGHFFYSPSPTSNPGRASLGFSGPGSTSSAFSSTMSTSPSSAMSSRSASPFQMSLLAAQSPNAETPEATHDMDKDPSRGTQALKNLPISVAILISEFLPVADCSSLMQAIGQG